jgi:hypothetical protein
MALGLALTLAPLLLMGMSSQPIRSHGVADRVLSALVGPGMLVSGPLFGIHNLGFFVLTPLLNFLFWSGISYGVIEFYERVLRRAH